MQLYKNQTGQAVEMLVVDTVNNVPYPGDTENLTFYIMKDHDTENVVPVLDTNPVEVNPFAATGLYLISLSQAETNADQILITGDSDTPNIKVVPLAITTRSAVDTPILQRPVSSNRILQVRDRADGTYETVGEMNVTAGEPKQLWALEFKGTHLPPGQSLYGMSLPDVIGDDAAKATIGSVPSDTYGVCLTRAAYEFRVDSSGAADDDITAVITVQFSASGDGIVVYVPVNVKAAEE